MGRGFGGIMRSWILRENRGVGEGCHKSMDLKCIWWLFD